MNGESETAGALERLGMVEDVRHLLTSVTYGDTDPKLLDDVAAVVRQAISDRNARDNLHASACGEMSLPLAFRTGEKVRECASQWDEAALIIGNVSAGDLGRMVSAFVNSIDRLCENVVKRVACLERVAKRLQDASPGVHVTEIGLAEVPAGVDELIEQRNALAETVKRLESAGDESKPASDESKPRLDDAAKRADLVSRLRAASRGQTVWRVADPVTHAYMIEFDAGFYSDPEAECRKWFADHMKLLPSRYANMIVESVQVFSATERLCREAADLLETLDVVKLYGPRVGPV